MRDDSARNSAPRRSLQEVEVGMHKKNWSPAVWVVVFLAAGGALASAVVFDPVDALFSADIFDNY